jgi:hypothetical protein
MQCKICSKEFDKIDYHIENKVNGEVLCRDCHKELHPSYNT